MCSADSLPLDPVGKILNLDKNGVYKAIKDPFGHVVLGGKNETWEQVKDPLKIDTHWKEEQKAKDEAEAKKREAQYQRDLKARQPRTTLKITQGTGLQIPGK